jgi:periplasmic divalent cation tolerance protein
MTDFIVVYVTVGSSEEAEQLASSLVEERLAACVNRIKLQSIYRWEGKVQRSSEELLMIKTRRDLFDALKSRVQDLHSYTVPEVIALPILEGNPSYLQWLNEETRKDEA